MKNKLPKYDNYKHSNVEWLGDIPQHWEAVRMKHLFRDYSEKNKANEELLSVTQNQGVVPRTWVENRMVMPSGALQSFKYIEKGDFAISLRSFEGGLEYCHHNGIISPAYTVLKTKRSIAELYYKYLFKSTSFISELQTSVVGIREGKNISFTELSYSLLPVPPLSEQEKIAQFLDEKTTKIDKAIEIKQRQIELLKERRQILIHRAVTRGVGSLSGVETPLKDSGVEWIGEIPEHWEVKRLKYVLEEVNIRSESGQEELLSLSKYKGIVPKSSLEERAGQASSLIGYKKVFIDNLVINKMQAVNGLIGVSKIQGITSPDYSVYKLGNNNYDINYIGYLLIQNEYLSEFKKVVTGVMEGFIRLYTDDLFRISIQLPSENEQKSIVSHIENISAKISKAIGLKEREIEVLKEYKSSLINCAVTGKVKIG